MLKVRDTRSKRKCICFAPRKKEGRFNVPVARLPFTSLAPIQGSCVLVKCMRQILGSIPIIIHYSVLGVRYFCLVLITLPATSSTASNLELQTLLTVQIYILNLGKEQLHQGVSLPDKNAIEYWCTIVKSPFAICLHFHSLLHHPNHYEESPLRPSVYPIYHKL